MATTCKRTDAERGGRQCQWRAGARVAGPSDRALDEQAALRLERAGGRQGELGGRARRRGVHCGCSGGLGLAGWLVACLLWSARRAGDDWETATRQRPEGGKLDAAGDKLLVPRVSLACGEGAPNKCARRGAAAVIRRRGQALRRSLGRPSRSRRRRRRRRDSHQGCCWGSQRERR